MDNPPADPQRMKRLTDRLAAHSSSEPLGHLARAVLGSDDPKLSHAEVQAWLPSYVADEVGGLSVAQHYSEIKRHLDLCATCEAEYLDLLKLAQLEANGQLSSPPVTPRPDLSFLSPKVSLLDYVRTVARDLTTSLKLESLPDFQAVADRFFEWIERQGGQLIPVRADIGEALGLDRSDLRDLSLILAATQLATQALVDDLTMNDIQGLIASGRLESLAREHAERSALKAGLDPRFAGEFAQRYTEQTLANLDRLKALITSRSS